MKVTVHPVQEVRIVIQHVLLPPLQAGEKQRREVTVCVLPGEILLVVYSRNLRFAPVRVQQPAEVNTVVQVHALRQ